MIPARLIRTVPQGSSPEADAFWERWAHLHPGWDMVTLEDPLDAADYPETGHLFRHCRSGAQKAGLVRLEAVWRMGGVYVDADFEPLHPIDCLRVYPCFIGTQDGSYLTDALFGAEAGHPAIRACLDRVLTLRMSEGPLVTGPDNTTTVLTGRDDVTILPPALLYPYSFTEPHRRHENFHRTSPDALAVHHWAGSWLR